MHIPRGAEFELEEPKSKCGMKKLAKEGMINYSKHYGNYKK